MRFRRDLLNACLVAACVVGLWLWWSGHRQVDPERPGEAHGDEAPVVVPRPPALAAAPPAAAAHAPEVVVAAPDVGHDLRIRVTSSSDGGPVVDASVWLPRDGATGGDGEGNGTWAPVGTGGELATHFGKRPAGPVRVVVASSGIARTETRVPLADGPVTIATIVVGGSSGISGRVGMQDGDGPPASAATVAACPASLVGSFADAIRRAARGDPAVIRATTTEHGSFRLDGLADAVPYLVVAWGHGFVSTSKVVVVPPAKDPVVVTAATLSYASIQVVSDGPGASPRVSDARVRAVGGVGGNFSRLGGRRPIAEAAVPFRELLEAAARDAFGEAADPALRTDWFFERKPTDDPTSSIEFFAAHPGFRPVKQALAVRPFEVPLRVDGVRMERLRSDAPSTIVVRVAVPAECAHYPEVHPKPASPVEEVLQEVRLHGEPLEEAGVGFLVGRIQTLREKSLQFDNLAAGEYRVSFLGARAGPAFGSEIHVQLGVGETRVIDVAPPPTGAVRVKLIQADGREELGPLSLLVRTRTSAAEGRPWSVRQFVQAPYVIEALLPGEATVRWNDPSAGGLDQSVVVEPARLIEATIRASRSTRSER